MAGAGIGMHRVRLKMAISPRPLRKSVSASRQPSGIRRKSEIYLGGLGSQPLSGAHSPACTTLDIEPQLIESPGRLTLIPQGSGVQAHWRCRILKTTPADRRRVFCTFVVPLGNSVRTQSPWKRRSPKWRDNPRSTPPPSCRSEET